MKATPDEPLAVYQRLAALDMMQAAAEKGQGHAASRQPLNTLPSNSISQTG